jgi:hypothetical protein
MHDETVEWLVCLRVREGYEPSLLSTKERCTVCGGEVWKAASSPDRRIICMPCARETAARENKPVTVNPPNEAQMRDIELKWARTKN